MTPKHRSFLLSTGRDFRPRHIGLLNMGPPADGEARQAEFDDAFWLISQRLDVDPLALIDRLMGGKEGSLIPDYGGCWILATVPEQDARREAERAALRAPATAVAHGQTFHTDNSTMWLPTETAMAAPWVPEHLRGVDLGDVSGQMPDAFPHRLTRQNARRYRRADKTNVWLPKRLIAVLADCVLEQADNGPLGMIRASRAGVVVAYVMPERPS